MFVCLFSVNAFAEWQGPYKIGMVQASFDGNVFLQVYNATGTEIVSSGYEMNFITQSSPEVAKGFRDVLLAAYTSGKKVTLYVSGYTPSNGLPNTGWSIVSNVRIADY